MHKRVAGFKYPFEWQTLLLFALADLCLETLLLRSKMRFAQARSAAVPDVQPREA